MPTATSSRVIPKEQLTAWERWELGALAEEAEARATRTSAAQQEESREAAAAAAREAAYAEGLKAARAETARLRAVADSATQALEALGQSLAERTTALAIAIARQIVRDELAARPEAVLAVVAEALSLMPAEGPRLQVLVNPQDAALVAQHLEHHAAPESWRLVEDSTVSRGGCRLQGPCGDVDATLESRWQRVLESLEAGHAA